MQDSSKKRINKKNVEPYYSRWDEPEVVQRFSQKNVQDFFDSEKHFLDKINGSYQSVLDIGCASGRLVELLNTYHTEFDFTGIDLSQASIESAVKAYPHYTFYTGNALDLNLTGPYDLVNATGVMQHEPNFEDLLEKMIQLSGKFVLFDVKVGKTPENINDIERSYSGSTENPLYFVILSRQWLFDKLRSLTNVTKAMVYGYQTSNRFATFPEEVGPLLSVGVLIEVEKSNKTSPPVIDDQLPVIQEI